MTVGSVAASGLMGIGYEGRAIGEFVDVLLAEGIAHLVDVRLTPISRKPGFSKTALSQALSNAGIAYDHRPELGNPKPNRAGFAGEESDVALARATFAEWISRPAATRTLDGLASLVQHSRVAILCFEADQARCHRDVVLAEIAERAITALGSKPRAR